MVSSLTTGKEPIKLPKTFLDDCEILTILLAMKFD